MTSGKELPDDVVAAMKVGRKIEAIRLLRLHRDIDLKEAKQLLEASTSSPDGTARVRQRRSENPGNLMKWVGLLVFGGLGALVIWFTVDDIRLLSNWIDNAARTTGTVVSIEEQSVRSKRLGQSGSSSSLTKILTVNYDAGGEAFELEDSSYLSDLFYTVGDAAEVLYEQGDPELAVLDHWFFLWGADYFYLGFGVMFVLGGLLSYFMLGSLDLGPSKMWKDAEQEFQRQHSAKR